MRFLWLSASTNLRLLRAGSSAESCWEIAHTKNEKLKLRNFKSKNDGHRWEKIEMKTRRRSEGQTSEQAKPRSFNGKRKSKLEHGKVKLIQLTRTKRSFPGTFGFHWAQRTRKGSISCRDLNRKWTTVTRFCAKVPNYRVNFISESHWVSTFFVSLLFSTPTLLSNFKLQRKYLCAMH